MLHCPRCTSGLDWGENEAICSSANCGGRYPILDGVPVLIDESKSIFDIADFVERRETTFRSADRLLKDRLPAYGYRRVTHELRRRGMRVNHKRVARVMREAALTPRRGTAVSRHD